ncbi:MULTISPECIES: D-aminoacyl-tRNA deacylase [Kyrpidia]|uniref:Gly-tRNA(Ala) deacylase / D-Tyr-tRNATyr deacylase n=1 Tax=Kyrpidia spormannii TaxID=2055160 RepID=A0ACA8ZB53_9BACL|nr:MULTISPECIES: D-aminoacyl-tRNA deacylase [Kyrpidia]MCL6575401.1 D-tyrosyl-tRNA(Tyr) deacylase [Kyrpidia sp.]CAB3393465.1 gly-tRNA(Ala) deacylase / D-Tyr-tRNATyr deacylase [Kyrpidia spormannii]
MRAVVQRVSRAEVRVEGERVAHIGKGLLVLIGVSRQDGEADAVWLAEKLAGLRVFPDDAGKMGRSVLDVGGAVLSVSQFTLLGDCRKGRRPDFTGAAPAETALPLYERVNAHLREKGVRVETGVFGAHMDVELVNDGPVTLWLDSRV